MTRESLVFLLGILIFIVPFTGVPTDWKEFFLMVAGVLLIWSGYSLRRLRYLQSIVDNDGELHSGSFSESTGKRSLENSSQ